ncbi:MULTISPECIES: MarR family winged helix-turn-helix transcriptional regulator [unclassified Sphingomonas]|uniref:MarR family winged helix-turn-helix transcriptional regulator n=1 Tax=unclassified Sphingomonas TaxID=196159 RepID=UPI0006FC3852|nr:MULTISPECIES: MarR family winged helix-turn-helix transcriptional regulator [unclassified Sphingomonas]KQX18395.1 hypothetical protein ASD17_14635 [Sphingomonas sp. Root1294]KQY72280.1 hypothetical protein ASD39_20340 [Sphingomonas sp. Root50]KRB94449.1 hypothetical protein ASE22_00410 [Sphingomonas sp. Root720]
MTGISPHEGFELHILKRLARGPDWSQRFPRLKPVIDRLQDQGHVERYPAPGAKVPLMIRITASGEGRLAALRRKAAA